MRELLRVASVIVIAYLVAGWRQRNAPDGTADTRSAVPTRPATVAVSSGVGQVPQARVGDSVTGLLIGHAIATGDVGFPGDPLPGGELGSPASLAFWGSMFDDDEEDEDDY